MPDLCTCFEIYYYEYGLQSESKKLKVVKSLNSPKHIAFIADGNRTYAKQKNMRLEEAYIEGMEKIFHILALSDTLGISTISFFLFSSYNNQRNVTDKKSLLTVLEIFLEKLRNCDTEYAYNVLGNTIELPGKIHALCTELTSTKSKKEKVINLAINYSGKYEILAKCHNYLLGQPSEISCEDILDDLEHPFTEPDLVIRTSGQKRLSDFLLWQTTDSILFFSNLCWPEFCDWSLLKAIFLYQIGPRKCKKNS